MNERMNERSASGMASQTGVPGPVPAVVAVPAQAERRSVRGVGARGARGAEAWWLWLAALSRGPGSAGRRP